MRDVGTVEHGNDITSFDGVAGEFGGRNRSPYPVASQARPEFASHKRRSLREWGSPAGREGSCPASYSRRPDYLTGNAVMHRCDMIRTRSAGWKIHLRVV